MKMNRVLILVICLSYAFMCVGEAQVLNKTENVRETREMENDVFDQEIIEILGALACPQLVAHIDYTTVGSFSIIKESKLILVESRLFEDKTIELYKGKENQFLAVLRNDNDVYCAQYINGITSTEYVTKDLSEDDIYMHEFESPPYMGMYLVTRIGFFIDGAMLFELSGSQPFEPWSKAIEYAEYSECILALGQ